MNNTNYPTLSVEIHLSFYNSYESWDPETEVETYEEHEGSEQFTVTIIHPRDIKLISMTSEKMAEMAGISSSFTIIFKVPSHELVFNDEIEFIKWYSNLNNKPTIIGGVYI